MAVQNQTTSLPRNLLTAEEAKHLMGEVILGPHTVGRRKAVMAEEETKNRLMPGGRNNTEVRYRPMVDAKMTKEDTGRHTPVEDQKGTLEVKVMDLAVKKDTNVHQITGETRSEGASKANL